MSDRNVLDLIPLARMLGLVVARDNAAEVALRFSWRPELCTSGGVLHGGAIMAAADTAGAICALRNLPPDASGTVTVESKTNFLRSITGGHIDVLAKPIHAGRTLIVVESNLTDEQQRLVARVTQSQMVLRSTGTGPGGSTSSSNRLAGFLAAQHDKEILP